MTAGAPRGLTSVQAGAATDGFARGAIGDSFAVVRSRTSAVQRNDGSTPIEYFQDRGERLDARLVGRIEKDHGVGDPLAGVREKPLGNLLR